MIFQVLVRDIWSPIPEEKLNQAQWWNQVPRCNLFCLFNSNPQSNSQNTLKSYEHHCNAWEQFSNLRKFKRASLYKLNHLLKKDPFLPYKDHFASIMINTLSIHANLTDDLGQSTDVTHLYWVVHLSKCVSFYNWSEYPKIQETNSLYEDKCYVKCCGGTTIHQPINTLTFLSMQSSKILSHMLKIQYMLK